MKLTASEYQPATSSTYLWTRKGLIHEGVGGDRWCPIVLILATIQTELGIFRVMIRLLWKLIASEYWTSCLHLSMNKKGTDSLRSRAVTDDALLYSFQSATNPFDQTNKTSEVMLLYGCNRPALLTVSGAWRHLLYQLMKYHMTFSVQRALGRQRSR